MNVTIVHTSLDIEQCLDIRRSVFCGILGLERDSIIDGLDADSVHALASVGPKPVASGRLCSRGGEWWMEHVAVLPAFRGQGTAREVIRVLMEEAARRGIAELRVEAAREFSGFLEKMGFQLGVVPVILEKGENG